MAQMCDDSPPMVGQSRYDWPARVIYQVIYRPTVYQHHLCARYSMRSPLLSLSRPIPTPNLPIEG